MSESKIRSTQPAQQSSLLKPPRPTCRCCSSSGFPSSARKCGVYGQATGLPDDPDYIPQKDRRVAPRSGTGVCGSGNQGVYGSGNVGVYGGGGIEGVLGVSESVDISGDAPVFDSGNGLGMGVVGVNSTTGGSFRDRNGPFSSSFTRIFSAPAILGDNDVLNSDFLKFSAGGAAVFDEIRTLPVGVEGISWSGLGVYGISFNLDPVIRDPTKDPRVLRTASDPILDAIDPPTRNQTAAAGVLGLSMQGAGVRGVSRFDRGGIFQSATVRTDDPPPPGPTDPVVAQIRLVPHRVHTTDPHTNNPQLPSNGETGDLLVVVSPTSRLNRRFDAATLWFCERGAVPSATPAVWRRVSLADSVTGS